MNTRHHSDWTWTVEGHVVRDLDRWSDPALQDALVGWRGLPDELVRDVPTPRACAQQDAA